MENKENVDKAEFQTMYHKYVSRKKNMEIRDDRLQSDCSSTNSTSQASSVHLGVVVVTYASMD